jgi:CheY-like chemotaxis protein
MGRERLRTSFPPHLSNLHEAVKILSYKFKKYKLSTKFGNRRYKLYYFVGERLMERSACVMGHGRKKTASILLIDDEVGVGRSLGKSLHRHGYDVTAFSDPVEAIGKFRAGVYELALLDIRMPRMNGFQVARAIRRIDPDAKILFITAFEILSREFERIFPEAYIQGFVEKPFRPETLFSKIDSVLSSESRVPEKRGGGGIEEVMASPCC